VTGSDLAARAEHELRGAAAALALACDALRRDPAAHGHAAIIDAQLDRLRAGLEDLQTARGEASEGGAPVPTDLEALSRAAARPFGTSFEWEGGPVPANIDRRRFAKAIGNVLANASEHGSGDIRVTGTATDGGVRLQVRNRGRGLAIATEAAEELGGSLSFEIVDDVAVATLDLPAE
jgi:signal transduction histidine kinase